MGSGFKTFTAGAVLTASDVNNYLMEQSVMVFATTAARDSALPSGVVEAGMLCYINSADANEGLYHNTAGTVASWNKGPSWNAPWGYMTTINGSTAGTVIRAGAGSGAVDLVNGSYTAMANRRIQFTASCSVSWTSSAASALDLKLGGTSVAHLDTPPHTSTGGTLVAITTGTGASISAVLQVLFAASVSAVTAQVLTQQIIVEDIGPSGAPV